MRVSDMQHCGTDATLRRVPICTLESRLRQAEAVRQQSRNSAWSQSMMWHVVFAEPGKLPRSRAARSRDGAILAACELLAEGNDVRRIIEPSGSFIERAELDEHYDGGRFPGLRIPTPPPVGPSLRL